MISTVGHDRKLQIAEGIKRFFSEGYVCWSKDNLMKVFGGELKEIDMLLLKDWEKNGFISICYESDCYIEIIKVS